MWSLLSRARWSTRSAASTLTPASTRVEVCPPSLRQVPASAWQRLVFWLLAPAPEDAAPAVDLLPPVRADFHACMFDIAGDDAARLRTRIDDTRTLRELWHLRAEVYRVVGHAHSQWEAERRLAGLNRHFRTRLPRTSAAAGGTALRREATP